MHTKECIGIVGGLGPYAGLDLVRKIFDATRASHDQEHLPVMLYSFPGNIPARPEFLLGLARENPGEAIGSVMAQMALAGATIIGMPCNTAHSPRILDVALARLAATGRGARFIHMVDAAVAHMGRMCPAGGRVGLLATVATLATGLYQNALQAAGLTPVLPDDGSCAQVQDAISNRAYGIKACANPVSQKARASLRKACRELAERKVKAILLGCTEIPLALTESELFGVPVADATRVLAEALVLAYDPQKLCTLAC